MAKRHLHACFALGASLLLASCSFGINWNSGSVTLNEVERAVYNSASFAKTGSREQSLFKTYKFKVNAVRSHILYCDLPTYADMVSARFVSGTTYTCSASQWVVKKGESTIFIGGIDAANSRFYYGGSLTTAFMSGAPDYGTLLKGLNIVETKAIAQGEDYGYASFADFNTQIPLYVASDVVYAPVALFDMAFSPLTGLHHYDNLKSFYQIADAGELDLPMEEGGQKIAQNVGAYHQANGMPVDLRLLDKACFYFHMDNFYGLRVSKGISSMSTYYRSLGFDSSLLEEDDAKRAYAYYDAFAVLNDDHSGIRTPAYAWGNDGSMNHRGPLSVDRKALAQGLKTMREEAYGEQGGTPLNNVIYSDSGETAFFSFDEFVFEKNPYQEDGKTYREDLWKTDTAAYFLRQFASIEAKGGVKRVVIDDSCNGGGTLGVAMKLLALVSKDNRGTVYTQDLAKGGIVKQVVQYDSNMDGVYDEKDVYGDDFEISILTSPRSFSCGNLFPCMARFSGVKILGVKSGGGECTVSEAMLPSGYGIAHSSNTRLVDVNEAERTYYGLEVGAPLDIAFDYSCFYDVNAVEALLNPPEI